ncbi:MAG: class I SAM-dependent methyltransferase [Chloroflexota bacterium]|nr:class I SAM-dependent methyltransferase [Dehalococcoidia bacterium]MDW8255071.1 class I SAM-dependent methyltransferase [Chloroflexota bacterium]
MREAAGTIGYTPTILSRSDAVPGPASGEQYLRDFLRIAPLSHAMFRAVEALAFRQVELEHPVLDLGCGFGEFAGVVFDQLEMGIDINEADLDLGRRSNKYQRMLWSDARRMPFQSGSFATVVSVSVLEHIQNVPRALAEAARVLRPGGLLVVTVPTEAMYRHLFFPRLFRALGLPQLARWYLRGHRLVFKHVTIRPADWWKEQLSLAGFVIERCEGTISPRVMQLHDLFLLTAFPSQLAKWVTGRRLLMTTGLRARLLPLVFGRLIRLDRASAINLFIVARKRREG